MFDGWMDAVLRLEVRVKYGVNETRARGVGWVM